MHIIVSTCLPSIYLPTSSTNKPSTEMVIWDVAQTTVMKESIPNIGDAPRWLQQWHVWPKTQTTNSITMGSWQLHIWSVVPTWSLGLWVELQNDWHAIQEVQPVERQPPGAPLRTHPVSSCGDGRCQSAASAPGSQWRQACRGTCMGWQPLYVSKLNKETGRPVIHCCNMSGGCYTLL